MAIPCLCLFIVLSSLFSELVGACLPQALPGTSTANWNLSGRGPSICSRRPFGHLKAPLGFHCFANANFTYLDNGNVNFPDNKKYSRSKPTIIRIPPTTLMPIRLTLLFFIILFAKTNSSAPTTIIKTDINGYMSFLLSNSDLLSRVYHTTSRKATPYMPELSLFPAYVRTGHVRTYTAIAPNASYRVTTKFAQSELDSAKQKAGYHYHSDTLPLLVYRSE